MSSFIRHLPCKSCGSRDNLGEYTDHFWCFGCGFYEEQTDLTREEYVKVRRIKKNLAVASVKKQLKKTLKSLAEKNIVLTAEQEQYLSISSIRKQIYHIEQSLEDETLTAKQKLKLLATKKRLLQKIELMKKNHQRYSRAVKEYLYLESKKKRLLQKMKLIEKNYQHYSRKATNSLTDNFYMSNSDLDRVLNHVCDREIEWAAIERDESLQKAA